MTTLAGSPYGQTETGAAYSEAALRARAHTDAPDTAYLLGVAQQALKTALQLDSLIEVRAYLSEVLERIQPEVAA